MQSAAVQRNWFPRIYSVKVKCQEHTFFVLIQVTHINLHLFKLRRN